MKQSTKNNLLKIFNAVEIFGKSIPLIIIVGIFIYVILPSKENNPQTEYQKTKIEIPSPKEIKDDTINGVIYKYWHNGSKKESIPINEKGQAHGLRVEWWFNGQKCSEIPHRNGQYYYNNVVHKRWDSNGQMTRKEIYKDFYNYLDSAWNKYGELTHYIDTKNGKIMDEWFISD